MSTRTIIATVAILACALPALARGPSAHVGRASGSQSAVTVEALSPEEAASLLWMREEEKLARDVYLTLYEGWGEAVFTKIATSEQRHFDALGAKIDRYGLSDPALAEIGAFSEEDLTVLYEGLVGIGNESYVQALIVGATIEDMDIADLQVAIAETDNADLKTTYGHLLEGSKNHLRAFVGLLRALGEDYAPQYIDPVLFDAIIGV